MQFMDDNFSNFRVRLKSAEHMALLNENFARPRKDTTINIW